MRPSEELRPAGYLKDGAIDEAGRVRSQEGHGSADLRGLRAPAEGMGLTELLDVAWVVEQEKGLVSEIADREPDEWKQNDE